MRKERETNKRRKLLPTMLAVVLAALMIVPMESGIAKAEPNDGTKASYRLTVKVSESEEVIEDLSSVTNMRLDVYRVAFGTKDESYDTWHWTMDGAYKDLPYNENTFENKDFTELAAAAANIALPENKDAIAADATMTVSNATASIDLTDLGAGLYVIIPRDMKYSEGEDIDRDGSGNVISTKVESEDCIYTFSPSIVAVPGKNAAPGEPIGTAQSYGDWTNDVVMVLKPSQEELLGSIAVQKILKRYEDKDPATFVFSIIATKGTDQNGSDKIVYSDVVSITMNGAGTSELRLIEKKIPVGSYVTIKEIYAGANYDKSNVEEHPKVTAGEITEETKDAIASFTNDYVGTYKGGGSIENRFTKGGDETSWRTPEQIYAKTASAEE